jgi:uncharacterized protein
MHKISEKPLVRSQFVHLFEKNGSYCLFHSLTLRKVYGGQILKSLYEIFESSTHPKDAVATLNFPIPGNEVTEIIVDLKNKGLLVSSSDNDAQIYEQLYKKGLNLYPIRHMYFLPTSACNFKCKYCFVEDENRTLIPTYMTKETAKKGIEVFAKLTEQADAISMTFYGGEPLLNADIVYWSMRYVRTLEKEGVFKKPVRIALLTNGSLVDQKTVDALLETSSNVSISIDGPEHLHDLARIDTENNSTFGKAIKGYRMLQKAGLKPGISCTLNSTNIKYIEEIVDFIINELKPSGMGFNLLLPKINSGSSSEYSYEFAAKQLIKAFCALRENGIYEDRVMRRVRPYITDGFHLKDCMGVGGQIVLAPDGKIGPCQAFLGIDKYFPLSVDALHANLSSLTSETIYANPIFGEWRYRFPLNMKECAKCSAIAVCGGGCPYASLVNHDSIWEIDERVCAQAKNIFEWMIWDTYEHFSKDPLQKTPTDKLVFGKSVHKNLDSSTNDRRTMEEWFKKKFYDDLSGIRPERQNYYKHYVFDFVKNFFSEEKVAGKNILDFGCGPGFYAAILGQRGANVVGVDKDRFLIDKANEHKAKLGLTNVEFIQADFLTFGSHWSPKKFDYVLAIDTLVSFDFSRRKHNHEEVSKALSNISKVMKDDGKLYIIELHPFFGQYPQGYLSENNEYTFPPFPRYKIEYQPKEDLHHWFTLEELTRATSENKLALLRIYEPNPSIEMEKENETLYQFLLRYPGMIVYEICKVTTT